MCASTVLQRARPPVRLHGSAVLLYYTVAPRSADVQDGSVYDVQEGSVFMMYMTAVVGHPITV